MASSKSNADWHRRQLRWQLQALAAPASVQVTLYPDFTVKPEELALDFDHWYWCAGFSLAREWSSAQRAALAAVDAKLDAMSLNGAEFSEDLWLEPALAADDHWEEVRRLARAALHTLGWPIDDSPSSPEDRGSFYVH